MVRRTIIIEFDRLMFNFPYWVCMYILFATGSRTGILAITCTIRAPVRHSDRRDYYRACSCTLVSLQSLAYGIPYGNIVSYRKHRHNNNNAVKELQRVILGKVKISVKLVEILQLVEDSSPRSPAAGLNCPLMPVPRPP